MNINSFPVLILLAGLFFWGCRGTGKTPDESGKHDESGRMPAFTDRYDPLALAEDQEIAPVKYRLGIAETTPAMSEISALPMDDSASGNFMANEVFRIQLFTSKEYSPAWREMNIAAEIFDKKVWFDYEVPYYKVRVGDFASRSDAEKYLTAVSGAGYVNAWIVKVNTNVRSMDDVYEQELVPDIESPDPDEEEYPLPGDTTSESTNDESATD